MCGLGAGSHHALPSLFPLLFSLLGTWTASLPHFHCSFHFSQLLSTSCRRGAQSDRGLATVLDAFESSSRTARRDYIVVVLSDNGFSLGRKRHYKK